MGHGRMWSAKGRSKYDQTGQMIKESWASFTGWYLTNHAYASWGYGEPWTLRDSKQDWNKTKVDSYSPLFIDLYDDYNQYAKAESWERDNYPNDRIKYVPLHIIQNIAFDSYAKKSFTELIKYYIGKYFTRQEHDDYIAPYLENWS